MKSVWKCLTLLTLICVHVSCQKISKVDIGYFWQITDIHLDWRYSEVGDVTKMCHGDSPMMFRDGLYGNYSCDAPMKLADSAIAFMARNLPDPDFILWTGDNIPHVNDPEPQWDVVYETLAAIIQTMQAYFPGVPILPVLGNHDTYPKDAFPTKDNTFYSNYLNNGSWHQLIPASGHKSFLQGGYYAATTPSGLRVLGLNTNLYYKWNPNVTKVEDPGGQLAFMEKELKTARKNKQKAILMAHIPPGYFERQATDGMFSAFHTKRYLDVIRRYSDVITAQFYGHLHTDTFRLFSKETDEYMVAFASPSVTPWNATVPGGTAVNPSVRKYSYNKNTFDILDYWQYFFNLTRANHEAEEKRDSETVTTEIMDTEVSIENETMVAPGKAKNESENDTNLQDDSHVFWGVLYQATEAYGIKDVGGNSMSHLYSKLIDHNHSELFDLYYSHNSVGIPHPLCRGTCKADQLCAIEHFFDDDLNACKKTVLFLFGGAGEKEGNETKLQERPKNEEVTIEITDISVTTQVSSLDEHYLSKVINHASIFTWCVAGVGIAVLILVVVTIFLWLTQKKMRKMSTIKWRLRKHEHEYLLL